MITSARDAERLFDIAKRLRDERRKYERLNERSKEDLSPRQRSKLHADLNWQAWHICKIEDELHAAAVDAGLAECRPAGDYAERSVKFDGWHEYLYQPPRPACLTEAEAA